MLTQTKSIEKNENLEKIVGKGKIHFLFKTQKVS